MSIDFYARKGDSPVGDSINLSNRNGALVLAALGYEYSSEPFEEDINYFQGRCRSWLRKNLNKPSEEIITFYEGNIVEMGLRAGYLNEKILELSKLASEGILLGADLFCAT
jgi:hypothetical protein